MRSATILVPLVIMGCASAGAGPAVTPPPPQIIETPGGTPLRVEQQAIVSGGNVLMPIDSAWKTIIQVYQELGIEPTTLITEARTIGNQSLKIRRVLGTTPLSRYLNCGSGTGVGPNADYYNVEMSVMTHLSASTTQTTNVQTRVVATAKPLTVGSNPVECVTTGALEQRIVRVMQQKARA